MQVITPARRHLIFLNDRNVLEANSTREIRGPISNNLKQHLLLKKNNQQQQVLCGLCSCHVQYPRMYSEHKCESGYIHKMAFAKDEAPGNNHLSWNKKDQLDVSGGKSQGIFKGIKEAWTYVE